MKNKTLILALTALSTLGTTIKAQNSDTTHITEDKAKIRNYIGMAAGFTTGYGPCYELKYKKLGVQLVFTPFKNTNLTQHSIGFTPKYTFFSNSSVEVFSYLGTHYLYQKRRSTQFDKYGKEHISTKNNSALYNGLGAGILVGSQRPVNFEFMCGFLSKNMFQELNLTTEATLTLSLNKKDWK
jgi:hypothetical protein